MFNNRTLIIAAIGVFMLISACQRQLPLVTNPADTDSIIVVKSVHSVNYDDKDKYDFSTYEEYAYDSSGRKTVVSIFDSSLYDARRFTETFNYDKNGRLVLFESTTDDNLDLHRAEFIYAANGDIKKSLLYYNGGNKFENLFTYNNANGIKTIVMYDTSGTNGVTIDTRPRIVRYDFNAENKLVRQFEAATPSSYDKVRELWFKDTTEIICSYAGDNLEKKIEKYNYFYGSGNTPFQTDTTYYNRENKGAEVYNSFLNIYRNMYWFSIAETINNSFAETMVYTASYPHYFYFLNYPVKNIARTDFFGLGQIETGRFQNTINANGLLTKMVLPKNFANKYDGIAEIDFEYIKIKK